LKGRLLVAGGGSKKIAQMVISDGDYLRQGDTMLRELNVRFRDIRQGPDGLIYVLTEGRLRGPKDTDGMLLRLEPVAGAPEPAAAGGRAAAAQASPD
jgi:glucose/arabinose dehydrogenase